LTDKELRRVEAEVAAYMPNLRLHPDQLWIDGGAHIGLFTTRIQPFVKHVSAYEPDPENYEWLIKQSWPNVTSHREALGATNGIRELWRPPKSTTARGFYNRYRAKPLTVAVVAFATVLRETGATNVKLDIEGAEYEVLSSLADEDWARLEQLVMEVHWLKRVGSQKQYATLIETLTRHFRTIIAPEWQSRGNGLVWATR
jgi:FkbM family methyltransferase